MDEVHNGGNGALRAQLLDLAEKSQQADTYDTCNCVGCGDDCDCLACVAGVAWRKAYCAVLESGRSAS